MMILRFPFLFYTQTNSQAFAVFILAIYTPIMIMMAPTIG